MLQWLCKSSVSISWLKFIKFYSVNRPEQLLSFLSTVKGLSIQVVGVVFRYYRSYVCDKWEKYLGKLFLPTLENQASVVPKCDVVNVCCVSLVPPDGLFFIKCTDDANAKCSRPEANRREPPGHSFASFLVSHSI